MKNKRIVTVLCTAFLLTATSCGSSETDSGTATVDSIDFNNMADKEEDTALQSDNIPPQEGNEQLQPDNTHPQEDNEPLQPDNTQPQEDNAQPQSDTELDGSIESISNNSVVINKIYNISENVAVSYEDADKVLITVLFDEETVFEVQTVKNGGVNGDADVEKRQGLFSDMEIGSTLNMTGSYEGNDFHATQVIIYKFV